MFNFSRSKNKQFAICEWGLATPDSHGGGDNIVYIQQMYNWMTQATVYPYLLYQAYYDAGDSIISGPPLSPVNTNYPNSSKLYRSLFGPTNPFWTSALATGCTFSRNLKGYQCFGLSSAAATSASACQQACCAQSSCQIWQWLNGTANSCWIGTSSNCQVSSQPWIGGGH